jgi:hypothetical protein
MVVITNEVVHLTQLIVVQAVIRLVFNVNLTEISLHFLNRHELLRVLWILDHLSVIPCVKRRLHGVSYLLTHLNFLQEAHLV